MKNFESLFVVAVAVAVSATALVKTPAPAAAAPVLVKQEKMIQVVVSAKRPTPAEKARLDA